MSPVETQTNSGMNPIINFQFDFLSVRVSSIVFMYLLTNHTLNFWMKGALIIRQILDAR
jgi:hypothetical protein